MNRCTVYVAVRACASKMATTRTSNGCPKAKRKPYTDLQSKFRATPRYLATIDFGTTHCSVAYLSRPDLAPNPSEIDPTLLKLDDSGNRRVPSCILFDNNGNKMAVGNSARERFAAMDHELRPRYLYFEHVKKLLQHEKVCKYYKENAGISEQGVIQTRSPYWNSY